MQSTVLSENNLHEVSFGNTDSHARTHALDSFNAELTSQRYWLGPRVWEVGG